MKKIFLIACTVFLMSLTGCTFLPTQQTTQRPTVQPPTKILKASDIDPTLLRHVRDISYTSAEDYKKGVTYIVEIDQKYYNVAYTPSDIPSGSEQKETWIKNRQEKMTKAKIELLTRVGIPQELVTSWYPSFASMAIHLKPEELKKLFDVPGVGAIFAPSYYEPM